MNDQTVNILLVDDDDIDVEAVQRSFRKAKIANPIQVAADGLVALDILRGNNGHSPIPRPYMILLDLNMPRMNGIEFLEEVRQNPDIKDSVIFVLTTSNDDRDKVAAYEKNVAGYLVKSNAGTDFVNLIEFLEHYWRYIELPPIKDG